MKSPARLSLACAALALALPMLAGATPPPPKTLHLEGVCTYGTADLTVEFHESGTTAQVMASASQFTWTSPPPPGSPRWVTVYAEASYRPSPSDPWVSNTEQHSNYGWNPAPAVAGQTVFKSTTCELKGRAILSVGCSDRTTLYKTVELSWPGCGT